MNPIKRKIIGSLDSFPSEFNALKEHSLKYIKYSSIIDEDRIGIGHRPWVAPYNFAISLFAPAKKAWFSKFKQNNGKPIPLVYQKFLLASDGCFCYDLALFGLPPSMEDKNNLLNRKKLECLDLGLANKDWINEYDVDRKSFYFGNRALSENENVGFFIYPDENIYVKRDNGETIGQYVSFKDFLDEELKVAESMMKEEIPDDWWN